MRFKCIKCGTKYRIDNERVRGRAIRVRCRTCDSILKVRDPGLKPAELPGTKAKAQSGEGVQAAKIKTLTTRVARPAEGQVEPRKRRPRRARTGAGAASETPAAEREESTATGVAGPAQDRVFYEDTRVDEQPLHHREADQQDEGAPDEGALAADLPDDGWFRVLGGKPEGPYKLLELVAQAAGRRLGLDDLVWQPSWEEWHPAQVVPQLARAAEAKEPPPAPAGRHRTTHQVSTEQLLGPLPGESEGADPSRAPVEAEEAPQQEPAPEPEQKRPQKRKRRKRKRKRKRSTKQHTAAPVSGEHDTGTAPSSEISDSSLADPTHPDASMPFEEPTTEDTPRSLRPRLHVIAGGREEAGETAKEDDEVNESDLFSDDFFTDPQRDAEALDDGELQALEDEARELERALNESRAREDPKIKELRDLDFDPLRFPTQEEVPDAAEVRKLQREFSVMVRLQRQRGKQKLLMGIAFVAFFVALGLGLSQWKARMDAKKDAAPPPPAAEPLDLTDVLFQKRYDRVKPKPVKRPAAQKPGEQAGAAPSEAPAEATPEPTPAAKKPTRSTRKTERRARPEPEEEPPTEVHIKAARQEKLKAVTAVEEEDGKVETPLALKGTAVLGPKARPLTAGEVDKVMRANASKMASCKTQLAPQTVSLTIQVATSGLIQDVGVKMHGGEDPEMSRCLRGLMRRWIFDHELPAPQSFERTVRL